MRCMQASMASGSAPSRALAKPRVMPLDSGASTAARTTVGAESTSPQPVMPASVSMRIRHVSCVPSAAVVTSGSWRTMAWTAVIFMAKSLAGGGVL